MTTTTAYTGARIFDGERWHDDAALLAGPDGVEGIIAADAVGDRPVERLAGGMLVPGFIDLQVNGGGGALVDENTTVETLRTICRTYYRFGTTALLPTLITETREVTRRVIEAGIAAAEARIPGFLGLHLEGPHLSIARKGAHDPKLIRPMDEADLDMLVAARRRLPNLLTTVAAETVDPQQIARLAGGGVVVSIGHSEGTFAQVEAAAAAGASMVTHLFNAQSQLGNREPGVVGTALADGRLSAGLIADDTRAQYADLHAVPPSSAGGQ